MLAIGVDLSAEEPSTWMASVELLPAGARLVSLEASVSNARIVAATVAADVLGIDCPLGWPIAFVDFINEHRHGDVAPRHGKPIDWRRELAYRETDRFVVDQFKDGSKLRSLSVSADRISHAAMRCAALLAELKREGVQVDRSGMTGKVVEVYPAASLARWRLTHRRYKRTANTPRLSELVTELRVAAPWLDLGEHEPRCRASDDALDSVIASLSAAAARSGLTSPPTGSAMDLAGREGWIAVPKDGSLSRLLEATARSSEL
jgi:predicted nuclease with RNAse H fold